MFKIHLDYNIKLPHNGLVQSLGTCSSKLFSTPVESIYLLLSFQIVFSILTIRGPCQIGGGVGGGLRGATGGGVRGATEPMGCPTYEKTPYVTFIVKNDILVLSFG